MSGSLPAAEIDSSPLPIAPSAASAAAGLRDAPRWQQALGQRLAKPWLLKMAGTTIGIASFFPAYFYVMHAAAPRARQMPLVFIDHWVGVSEQALLLYASLWFYVSLPVALAKDLKTCLRYAAATAVMSLADFVLFWTVPTSVPPFAVDWALYPSLAFSKTADAAGNACPSLHVSFAVLACAVLAGQLRAVAAPSWLRAVNLLWAAGIVYSTLATRQHVALDVLDVLGGMLLGGLCWAVFWCRSMSGQQLQG